MDRDFGKRVQRAVDAVGQTGAMAPRLALVTGTGLAPLLDRIEVSARLAYRDIPDFPQSSAPGHKGEFVFGHLCGQPVVAQNGRFHLYEGWSPADIVLPVYVMRALGAQTYVVTNAAGGLNPDFPVGAPVLIGDQMNFTGVSPLIGPNDDALGLRFPDMSRAYDPDLRAQALGVAPGLKTGIYAGLKGPEFETSAERRHLRASGADLVGMSTVQEVIAANHAGLKVLGFSVVTNSAAGGPDQQPDTIEEVLEVAAKGADEIRRIVLAMLEKGVL